jgi:dolichol kinase
MIIATGILAAGSLTLELARFRYLPLNRLLVHWLSPLLKEGEDRHLTGSTYLLIASFIAFLFFDRGVAIAALLFLSLGDPAAALVGKRMPGPRVWGKSPGGTAAFVAVALVVVAILVATGAVPYHWGLLIGAGVAGLVELAPLRLDDNLTIPLLSGAAMHLLAAA